MFINKHQNLKESRLYAKIKRMNSKAELGKSGEDMACRYLVDKGYRIIERNFRKPWGELDIIAKSRDKTLVFVEVKTMRSAYGRSPEGRQFGNQSGNQSNSYPQLPDLEIGPEMQMTSAKIKKTKRAASLYAGSFPKLVDDLKGWRIDLLALTINGENCVVKHYENI